VTLRFAAKRDRQMVRARVIKEPKNLKIHAYGWFFVF
jgi:hypothetical protein